MKSWRIVGIESRASGPSAAARDRHVAPAEHALPVVDDGRLEDGLVLAAARRIAREEAHGDGVVAGRGERLA